MTKEELAGSVVNLGALPKQFPTNLQEGAFWESLGRAVATFGFLEEVLGRAIFALTATRSYEDEAECNRAFEDWLPKLKRALMDPLGSLIGAFGKAVRDHGSVKIENLDELLVDLRKVAEMRNILCHGSWGPPNASGASVPFFVNRKERVVDSAIDSQFLEQVQRHTAELACMVINTVTHMGWQFPGSEGPGKAIWEA